METIIFGPADFMASINMKSLVVGEQPPGYPADAYHYILMRILMAARAHDLQAIDGPYLQIRNVDGYREVAQRAAALGFDGKWVLHPGQVEASNEIFSPSQEDYDHAELILDAYDYYTSEAGGKKGSAMLGDEMIDEASRKMALVISGKGRAAGMQRTSKFETPEALSAMQFGRTYEEFEVGAVYKHWPGKTVTEYDDHLFCLLTMNHHPLHMDSNYAEKTTDFGKNVVVGQLHLLAAARHVRAGRLRQGHRQPGDRVAASTWRRPSTATRSTARRPSWTRRRRSRRTTAASCTSRPRATSRTARWSASSAAR